jgi:AcrR family transcriptional regulator
MACPARLYLGAIDALCFGHPDFPVFDMPAKKTPTRAAASPKPKLGPSKPKLAPSKPKPARQAAVKRKPGRPARISREAIISKTMELLTTCDVDDFMIKTLADELGTVSMAIYNYFSSREELLEVVADEVCLLFKLPKVKPGDSWQSRLEAWLWAFKKHADHYPVIHNIINIEGHTAAGWFRVTAPVSQVLHDIGLRDKKLALASYLFVTSAVSMIRIESISAVLRKPAAFTHFERLSAEEQQLMMSIRPHMAAITEKDVYNTFFAQLIRGVESLL